MSDVDVIKFWDEYQANGMEAALATVGAESFEDLQDVVPTLVEEAKSRDIDLVEFLVEFDKHLAEKEDATGTDNGSDELPTVGSDEVDLAEDENVAGESASPDTESDPAA